jgi:hypothetical protein
MVTLDESWLYFMTYHERIWLPEGTEAPQRERIIVQSRKTMLTIVCNHAGFYRIVALPKGMKFNAGYYFPYLLDRLAEWRRSEVGGQIEGCMSTRAMLELILRRRLPNSSQAIA